MHFFIPLGSFLHLTIRRTLSFRGRSLAAGVRGGGVFVRVDVVLLLVLLT